MATKLPKGEVVALEQLPCIPTQRLTLCVRDTTDSFMNQLRWAIGRDIPTIALYQTTILQTSPFPDEYISHRVALMPFRPKRSEVVNGEIRLEARTEGRVYAKDIVGDLDVLTPNLVVTTLPRDCFIQLVGKFDVGVGKDHQRYNHVAAARVCRHSVGFDRAKDECWCKDTAPGATCRDCAGVKFRDPAAPIEHIFEFESFGQLPPHEVLRQTLLITRSKLNQIALQMRASGAWKPEPDAALAEAPGHDDSDCRGIGLQGASAGPRYR